MVDQKEQRFYVPKNLTSAPVPLRVILTVPLGLLLRIRSAHLGMIQETRVSHILVPRAYDVLVSSRQQF